VLIVLAHFVFGCTAQQTVQQSDAASIAHIAIEYGSVDLLNKALKINAAVVHTKNTWGQTPLHLAAQRGEYEIVTRLIHAGAEIDARDQRGRTPLMEACVSKHIKCVEILLDAGASVELTSDDGRTPLDFTKVIILPTIFPKRSPDLGSAYEIEALLNKRRVHFGP